MKKFKHFICLVILTTSFSHAQVLDNDLEDKNILVVYGGWEGHKPKLFAEKIASWLKEKKANVYVSDTTAIYTDTKLLKKLDLIIQHVTMSEISENQINNLTKTIKNGTGLAGCHGGLGDSFRDNVDFQYMVGGQFVKHPGNKINYTVNINSKKDPITKDIDDFNMTSEQYYMHVDPALEILATTKFSGKHDAWIKGVVVPVVWKKYYGKGRVFYNSIGHSIENFDIPEVWKITTRGLVWACK
ncbi:hypothetical protein DEJ39_01515 [Bacteroidetes bacterium SCGC AAA795-G10]|nr:hypothetical protein DEJ39_01515 [Bacteroidetes bacterium SCGC AAA795-G10]